MAAKKSATLDFTRQYLRKKPDASFAEIRDAGAERDLKIYPIVFGRAKALEGLVKVAPYGSKKKLRLAEEQRRAEEARVKEARVKEARVKEARVEESRVEAAAHTAPSLASPLDNIDAMIQGVRDNHLDRERYRSALIRISEILDGVL